MSTTPCRAGQSWNWDGVAFEILSPPVDAPPDANFALPAHTKSDRFWRNNGDCVLRISAGAHASLLPADI